MDCRKGVLAEEINLEAQQPWPDAAAVLLCRNGASQRPQRCHHWFQRTVIGRLRMLLL